MSDFTIYEKVEVLRNFTFIGLSDNFMRIQQDHLSGDLGYNPNSRVWAVYSGNKRENCAYATMWGKLGGKISFKIHKNKKPYSMYDAIWRKEYTESLKRRTYEHISKSDSFMEFCIRSSQMTINTNTNNTTLASMLNPSQRVFIYDTSALFAFCEFFPTTTDNLVKTAILSRLYL